MTLGESFALASTVVVLCITYYGVRWAMERKRFIEMCNKLPGPSLKGYDSWLAHGLPFKNTLNTVPGFPNIPRNFQVFLDFAAESNGLLFRLWIFDPYRFPFARCPIVLLDPYLIRQFLTDKSITTKFVKDKRSYQMMEPIIGGSLLTLPDGTKWKHQRKLVARGFNGDFLEFVNEVALQLLYEKAFVTLNKKLGTSSENKSVTLEMLEWSTRLTSEVLGLVAFSYSFGGLDEQDDKHDNSLYTIFQHILYVTSRRIRSPPLVAAFRFQENHVFDENLRLLDGVVDKVVKERLSEHNNDASISTGGKTHRDLLSYMLDDDDDNKDAKLSDKELRANIKLFMFAGQDTTATTLSFAFWELASHHEEQEKLRAEVDSLFDKLPNGQHPNYKDLLNLKYLDAVVKETLRMYAPAFVGRTMEEDITLTKNDEKFTIPKNATVYICPPISQRQSELFPDKPDKWIPERFMNSSSSPGGWFPFSVGPHSCVGLPMAMAELKIILAHVVRHYTLQPSLEMEEDPIPIIMMTVKPHKALLDIRARTKK